jgi:hypothetical protein
MHKLGMVWARLGFCIFGPGYRPDGPGRLQANVFSTGLFRPDPKLVSAQILPRFREEAISSASMRKLCGTEKVSVGPAGRDNKNQSFFYYYVQI